MTHEVELAKLKRQRTVLKAKFTKFINYIRDEGNRNNLTEIKLRLKNISTILEQFEDIQTQIDELTNEDSTDYDEFEKLYYSNISYAHDLIENRNAPPIITAQGAANANAMLNANAEIAQPRRIKLPKVELATFDGSYEKWIGFYTNFKKLIHDQTWLSALEKFQYLRSSLKGEAVRVIEALPVSEENYLVAWEALQARFDNKRVIIQNHIFALLKLPSITKESAVELRTFLDTILTHTRTLQSLNEPVEQWGSLLICILTTKIDQKTHTEWQKSLQGTEMPTFNDFTKFLEERCQILKMTAISADLVQPSKSTQSHKKQTLTTTQKSASCIICHENHKVYACQKLHNMEVNERVEKMKAAKVCLNCLNPGHRSNECKWSGCKKCGKKHNTLLHYVNNQGTNDNKVEAKITENKESTVSPNTKVHSAVVSTQVLLSTALINIKGKEDEMIQARVLLDSGSQSHFITKKLADRLKLPLNHIDLPVESLNQLETRIKHSVKTEIYSKLNNYHDIVEFLVIPRICNYLPNEFIDKRELSIPRNIHLADPKFHEPSEIDALLGAEIFYDLLCTGKIEIPGHKARFYKTKLGWIISGKIGNNKEISKRENCMLTFNSLHKTISKFWELEEIENKIFLSEEEFQVEEHFKATTRRDMSSGRYIVRLPFNEKIENLGESYNIAEKQFYALEKKLNKNPDLKKHYVEGMREAITLGHMKHINLHEIQKQHCFLPHHPVIRESSSTTKVRIVYNASAKTSTGLSLNDCIKIGAVVQNTSFDIILRFRTHQIVLLADIEKMYKQILLDERDAYYQLILWREKADDKLETFMIPVVLFGCASAPHSATRVLIQLAKDEKTRFPIASEILKRDCYVDDVITGTDTIEEAKKLRDELNALTNSGGFTLRKWKSNNYEVVQPTIEHTADIELFSEDTPQTKALGIQWNQQEDQITYQLKDETNIKLTKRHVLSNIAQIYDPIGLLGPVIVCAKMLMQKLWQCNAGWDDTLPDNICASWTNIKKQLHILNNVTFTRKVIISNAKRIEVHGFCDASEKAYGACIYLRSIDNTGKIFTNLLCSKNRIAPLKTVSLPKLELCAALLLSQLIKIVLPALCKTIDDIFLWSDSSITLQWIKTQPHLLKTFVANRVSEIRDTTKAMHWRHVSSQENIADILSRGQLPAEFINNTRWKTGPEWLCQPQSEWPKSTVELVPLTELKAVNMTTIAEPNLLLSKYSSFTKLKRVLAYILRFKTNTLKKQTKIIGQLTPKELDNALTLILKMTQRECFSQDIKQLSTKKALHSSSKLRALNPFLDETGLIRAGGEHPAAMQHGNSSSSGAATCTLALLLIFLHAGSFVR